MPARLQGQLLQGGLDATPLGRCLAGWSTSMDRVSGLRDLRRLVLKGASGSPCVLAKAGRGGVCSSGMALSARRPKFMSAGQACPSLLNDREAESSCHQGTVQAAPGGWHFWSWGA